eukprot:NODE_609_length_2251_cov_371.647086_g579_i0.p1 GENE.NODE_609_length_2251_cov_371.647086_g579_i0~~NODE_609_length_2251_cov_371.647086_g579_i0.p1  ORF type:complete len:709 (+),score=221.46 NODE_609_length_2251_cov_371.647086_g579_i0:56-2128(+)
MKLFLLCALIVAAFADQIEFYSLDGRRADPCVNQERLQNGVRPDCTDNSVQPWPSTTYLIPAAASPAGRTMGAAVTLTFQGKFFPTAAGTLRLSRPGVASCDTTALETVGVAFPALPTAATATVAAANGFRNTMTFTVPTQWASIPEVETTPRMLCFMPNGAANAQWTGLRIATVWNCDNSDTTANQCSARFNAFAYPAGVLTHTQQAEWIGRKTCCLNKVQTTLRVNQCINDNVETCCGAASVLPQMKCCSTTSENIAWADGTCPCRTTSAATDCPTGEVCCLATKYTELVPSAARGTDNNRPGQCYTPATSRCCDTGEAYDAGSQQCCSINGLQSVNVPCPCSSDAHCIGGQANYRQLDSKCCMQTAPVPAESTTTCNKYQNFPTGNGHYSQQNCIGHCIDTRFQVCCNGRACVREFEQCCNSTCCNRYNGTCQTGASRRSTSKDNWVEYGIEYTVCTTVEQLDVIRAWWMYILPTALLATTLASLALALVFASRVEHCARRALEKAVIFVALVAIVCAMPMFFAPIYKYGLVIVFVSLFAIITAAARKMKMYVACVIIQLILLLYLIDPFHGNDYLTFAVDRTSAGRPDPMAAGLWHTTTRMWDNHDSCWDFYAGYFKFDALMRDDRMDEPVMNNPAFGFCSRGWVSTLLVVGGFVYIAMITQFILSIIMLLVRGAMLRKATEVKWE